MVRQPAVIHIIRLVTEQVEQLGIHDGYNEVERIVGVGDDDKHCCPAIAQFIQFHLFIAHALSKLCDIKWYQPGPAGNQDRFRCLA